MKKRVVAAVAALLVGLFLGACSRDPEKAKRRYLENGDKYLAQGKYKEASIMYRNALKKDAKYGEAYAKLGEVELRRGEIRSAAAALRRAVELLPGDEEASAKLADIYLAVFSVSAKKDERLIAEVRDLTEALMKKNAKSYQGLRLRGFLAVTEQKYREAIEYFRQADAAKPGQPELLYTLAQVLSQDKQVEEAEKVLRQIIEKHPSYVQAYDFLTIGLVRQGRQKDAEVVARLKVENNPKEPRYRLQLAGFYRAIGNRPESDKLINEVLNAEGKDYLIRLLVGQFYTRNRDFDQATAVLNEGIKKFPEHKTEYKLQIVQVLVGQTKTQEALALAEQIVKEDPKSDPALAMKAALELGFGGKEKQQAAVQELQSLLSRTPNDVVTRYNLAKAYHNRGDLDAARIQYQEALKLRPNFVAAHVGLAQVFLTKREFGKALSTIEELLKFDPKNPAGRVMRVNALTNSGNLREARNAVTVYLQDNPGLPDLIFQLAIVNFVEGRYQEAEAVFKNLRQRFPGDNRLLFGIVEIMFRTNRQADAIKVLKDESAKNPGSVDLRYAYANNSMRIRDFDTAEKEYRKLLETNPQSADLHLRLGESLRGKGQIQAAIDEYRQAQKLAPNQAVTNLQLAMTLEAVGNRGESMVMYQNVVRIDPDNWVALNNLAMAMAEEGRELDQALTYAQRAKQKAPNVDLIADTLGWVYIKKNLTENAITVFRELILKDPKNPTFRYHYGVALIQKGDKLNARLQLNQALANNPPKDEAAKVKELLAKLG